MAEPLSVASISVSVTEEVQGVASNCDQCDRGILNVSFVGDDEKEFLATETNKRRTKVLSEEFTEIDLTEEASRPPLPYFCDLHSLNVSELVKNNVAESGTLRCPKECYYHTLEDSTTSLSMGENTDQRSATLNCTSYDNLGGSHSSKNPTNCKCRENSEHSSKAPVQKLCNKNVRQNKLADGVILQFCTPASNSRGDSTHSIQQLYPGYGVNYLDPSGSTDLHVYPPPTYRSIIEATIADAPPSYELVTGINTNVNEIAEESQKKREFSSRNWGSVNISKSGRLLIILILVITLIIGSILVLLAVLK